MESDEYFEDLLQVETYSDSESECEFDVLCEGLSGESYVSAGMMTYESEAFLTCMLNGVCVEDGVDERIRGASARCQSMLTRARDVMCTDYGVSYKLDASFTVSVPDLARLTSEMFETVLGSGDLQVRVGHVGALTATSDDIANMAVWDGSCFQTVTGRGTFKVHAVSSKVDGYPLVPVSVCFKGKVRNYCWLFCGEAYYLKPCSRFFERRAELKNGVVYTADGLGPVVIGEEDYPVCQSPIVGPTEIAQVLCLNNVSDGLILHVGIFEYKVKYAITVDLKFSSMIGYTSDGVGVIRMGVPNGVYEVDLETSSVVRPRRDRPTGNSSELVEKLRKAGTVSQFLNAIEICGVCVCDSLESHLLYTGEGVTCGVLTAHRPKSCTASDVDILQDLPVTFRSCYRRYKHSSVNFLKRLLSMRGYVIVNGTVLWIQEMLPRLGGGQVSKNDSDVRKKIVGLSLHPDEVYMDDSYYVYMDRPTPLPVSKAVSCVVQAARKARQIDYNGTD